nr:uracil-DNA glycosylase family protein [Thomasclavelia cocleata]
MREYHLIEPVYNQDSRILILGSFPSVKSRAGNFFYHHPQNRFWKILSNLYNYQPLENYYRKETVFIRT